ncbi:MAG: SPOR domain-containing protein [Phocaeicola sp.]|uniref:SPOR domain-containing protein n=1 Tax=Phocaeicola sp. TaxID=2773926 RepID=UPI003FA16B1A
MRYLFAIALAFFALTVKAQNNIFEELEQSGSWQGTVTIHQDSSIASLVGIPKKFDESGNRELKARGYRVQVYAGNNSRDARSMAHSVAHKVETEFPDIPVYTYFLPPRWLCRVGDFKSMEEAYITMRKLKATGFFKEVSIVREQINISKE